MILKAFCNPEWIKYLRNLKTPLTVLFLSCCFFSTCNVVETTIFLPIKTPSEQREAPPCSPPLCYNMFIKAADSFCPGRPTELPSRGKVKRSKMCHFLTGPCGALNTRPRQRVLREPRGGHITFNLWKGCGSELSGRHTVWVIHHRSTPTDPHHHPTVSTVYFSTVAPGPSQRRPDLWLLSSVTSRSPQSIAESLWTLPLPISGSV